MRQAAGDSAESCADRFHGEFEQINGGSDQQQSHDGSGNARRKTAADDERQQT